MSSHKQRIEGATAAPMIHEPSKPSALVPKHGGAKTKVSPDLHHTTASLNASQLAIADAEDDQRSALHVLAALSSTDDMPAEDLCDIIRLTEGCRAALPAASQRLNTGRCGCPRPCRQLAHTRRPATCIGCVWPVVQGSVSPRSRRRRWRYAAHRGGCMHEPLSGHGRSDARLRNGAFCQAQSAGCKHRPQHDAFCRERTRKHPHVHRMVP